MKKVLRVGLAATLVLALVVLGSFSPAQGKKGGGKTEDALARAAFRDYGVVGSIPGSDVDRIQSDGQFLRVECQSLAYAYHYADFDDPCEPGHRGNSKVYGGGPLDGQYFLRPTETNFPDPTRWLVLDFTDGLPGSECLNLDLQLSDYEGRHPDVVSPPVNADPCIDQVEVRFAAHKAFKSGAEYTTVGILIDGPDLMQRGGSGRTWVQWNAKWLLEFVNPLTITTPDPEDPNTVTLSITDGLDQAELWTIGKNGEPEELVGTYSMPFEVTITKLVP